MNVSKLLRAVETGRHWEAAAFLYISTSDFDQGVRVMVKHSPVAYNSDKFLEIIQKVRSFFLWPLVLPAWTSHYIDSAGRGICGPPLVLSLYNAHSSKRAVGLGHVAGYPGCWSPLLLTLVSHTTCMIYACRFATTSCFTRPSTSTWMNTR